MNYKFSDSEKKMERKCRKILPNVIIALKSASGEDVDLLYYPNDNENDFMIN